MKFIATRLRPNELVQNCRYNNNNSDKLLLLHTEHSCAVVLTLQKEQREIPRPFRVKSTLSSWRSLFLCHRTPLSQWLTEECGQYALLNTHCACLLLNEPACVWWKGIFREIQYLTGNQTESSRLIPALRSAWWGPYSNFLHLLLIWQLSVSAPRLPPALTRRRSSGELLILHRCQMQSLLCRPDGPCERHFFFL